MASIHRFEDLEAWRLSKRLCGQVYALTDVGKIGRDYSLKDQLRRAVISIPANIAEGFGRGGDREFCQFLSYAKASANEVRSLLLVAGDLQLTDGNRLTDALESADETAACITGLIRYLSQKGDNGPRSRRQRYQQRR
jgi:four helix bundle protein